MGDYSSIEDFNKQYGCYNNTKDLKLVADLKAVVGRDSYPIGDGAVLQILNAIASTCRHCMDRDHPCSCWDDR